MPPRGIIVHPGPGDRPGPVGSVVRAKVSWFLHLRVQAGNSRVDQRARPSSGGAFRKLHRRTTHPDFSRCFGSSPGVGPLWHDRFFGFHFPVEYESTAPGESRTVFEREQNRNGKEQQTPDRPQRARPGASREDQNRSPFDPQACAEGDHHPPPRRRPHPRRR